MGIEVFDVAGGRALATGPLLLRPPAGPRVRIELTRNELTVSKNVREIDVSVEVRISSASDDEKVGVRFDLLNGKWVGILGLPADLEAGVTVDVAIPTTTNGVHAKFSTVDASKARVANWVRALLGVACTLGALVLFLALYRNDDLRIAQNLTALVVSFLPALVALLGFILPRFLADLRNSLSQWVARIDVLIFFVCASWGMYFWLSYTTDQLIVNEGPTTWQGVGSRHSGRVARPRIAALISTPEGWSTSDLPPWYRSLFLDAKLTCRAPAMPEGDWCGSAAASSTLEDWRQCLAGVADGSGGAGGCGLTKADCGTAWIRDVRSGDCTVSYLRTLDPAAARPFEPRPPTSTSIQLLRFQPGDGSTTYISLGGPAKQGQGKDCSQWTPERVVRVVGAAGACGAIEVPASTDFRFQDELGHVATCKRSGDASSFELVAIQGARAKAGAVVGVSQGGVMWATELGVAELRFCAPIARPFSTLSLPDLAGETLQLSPGLVDAAAIDELNDGQTFEGMSVGGEPVLVCLGKRPEGGVQSHAIQSSKERKRWWITQTGDQAKAIAACERTVQGRPPDPCPQRAGLIAELKSYTTAAGCGPITVSIGPSNQVNVVSGGPCSLPASLSRAVTQDYQGCTVRVP